MRLRRVVYFTPFWVRKKSLPVIKIGILAILLLLLLAACGQSSADPDPTVQTLMAGYIRTVTAAASQASQPDDTIKALEHKATATAASFHATQTVEAAALSAANQATLEAAAPIIAELPIYGVNPERGSAAWIHPPVTLELDGFHEMAYKNDFNMITARDFVIAADITWDTQYGTSGCGFVMRADGDDETPSAYLVAASRGGTGYVYFLSQVEGKPSNYASIFARGKDAKFDWQKGSTNRLAVVGRGKELSIYSNYTLLGTFDVTAPPMQPNLPEPPPRPARPQISQQDKDYDRVMEAFREEDRKYQLEFADYQRTVKSIDDAFNGVLANYDAGEILEEGFVGFFGFTESGKATCSYDNAWLWRMNDN